MIFRFLCWLHMGHFVRRSAFIHRGPPPSWRTRAACWCGHYDIEVSGLCSQEEAQERAAAGATLLNFGVK